MDASTACLDCTPGSRCHGSLFPEPCPQGWFQNESAASACVICPRGRYGVDANESDACEACPPHTKCPFEGMLNWMECANGTFWEEGGNPNACVLAAAVSHRVLRRVRERERQQGMVAWRWQQARACARACVACVLAPIDAAPMSARPRRSCSRTHPRTPA
jgi:hypothetical protein